MGEIALTIAVISTFLAYIVMIFSLMSDELAGKRSRAAERV